MASWDELRVELRRLMVEAPAALVVCPDPDSERHEKRIRIDLAAWATEVAASLHATYGDVVDLRVGAKTFPGGQLWVRRPPDVSREPAGDAGLDVEPVTPLSVRAGRDARRDVRVTNRTVQTQVLITNGELSSAVTDSTGRVVGQYVGPRPMPRVGFEIEPQRGRVVPVWIGTAAVVPDLGYAVPPGQWGLEVPLATEDGRLLSSRLEIAIIP